MSDFMFPKPVKKKKRKKHSDSVLHMRDGTCYLCKIRGRRYHGSTEEHHIFRGNPNRQMSEMYGLKVYLCSACHREVTDHPRGEMDMLLREIGQRKFEENHKRQEFIDIFGRSEL